MRITDGAKANIITNFEQAKALVQRGVYQYVDRPSSYQVGADALYHINSLPGKDEITVLDVEQPEECSLIILDKTPIGQSEQ